MTSPATDKRPRVIEDLRGFADQAVQWENANLRNDIKEAKAWVSVAAEREKAAHARAELAIRMAGVLAKQVRELGGRPRRSLKDDPSWSYEEWVRAMALMFNAETMRRLQRDVEKTRESEQRHREAKRYARDARYRKIGPRLVAFAQAEKNVEAKLGPILE